MLTWHAVRLSLNRGKDYYNLGESFIRNNESIINYVGGVRSVGRMYSDEKIIYPDSLISAYYFVTGYEMDCYVIISIQKLNEKEEKWKCVDFDIYKVNEKLP